MKNIALIGLFIALCGPALAQETGSPARIGACSLQASPSVSGDSTSGICSDGTTGHVAIESSGKTTILAVPTSSQVDYLQFAGSASGSPGSATMSAQGSDSNINISLTPKGSGSVQAITPVATTLSTAASQGAAGFFIPFSTTAALSVGEIVSGTSIPSNTVINGIGNYSASITTTAAAPGSGPTVQLASTTNMQYGMLLVDNTNSAHIGNQCVINYIAGLYISSNCSLANVATSDSITAYPTVSLSTATTGTVGSGASVSFTSAASNVTDTSLTITGPAIIGGPIYRSGSIVQNTTIGSKNSDPGIDAPYIASTSIGAGANYQENLGGLVGGNTAIGGYALYSNSGNYGVYELNSYASLGNNVFNTAVGFESMYASVGSTCTANSGANSFNVAIGSKSLYNSTCGSRNVAVGEANSPFLSTGNFNVNIGSEMAEALTTGSSNVLIGHNVALNTLATGSSNILIGTSSTTDTNGAADTNEIAIGGAGLGSATAEIGLLGTTKTTTLYGGLVSGGTQFTVTGCSISATTGGANAGTYTSGTSGTCTAVITINGATGARASNGWSCVANDITTSADAQKQTASSATTATIAGTTVSGDVVNFHCVGY